MTLLLALLTDPAAAADVVIPLQGVAADPAGSPYQGTLSLTVRLWATANSATPLFEETHQAGFDAGRFAVMVGGVDTLAAGVLLERSSAWVSVSIHGAETDRVRIGEAPFAVHARNADTVGGLAPSAFRRVADPVGWSDLDLSAAPAEIRDGWVAGDGIALSGNSIGIASSWMVPWERLDLVNAPAHVRDGLTEGDGIDISGGTIAVDGTWVDSLIEAVAFDTVSELTAALDGTYLRADTVAASGLRIGNNTSACNSASYGALRFNGTDFEGCTAGGWAPLGGAGDVPLGSAAGTPAASCQAILDAGASIGNGVYWLTDSGKLFQAYCDMTTDGGGWMLTASFCTDHQWSLARPTTGGAIDATCKDAWSSNFGDVNANEFRVLASPTVDAGGATARGDWYYHRTTAIPWKRWWSPATGATGLYNFTAQGGTDAGIASFDWSRNLKFNVTNFGHRFQGLSDAAGAGNFWAALTTAGSTIDINAVSGDGNLGWLIDGTDSGQDTAGQHSIVGPDDGISQARYGTTAGENTMGNGSSTADTTRLWFFIRNKPVTGTALGSEANPATSCKALRATGVTTTGHYWITGIWPVAGGTRPIYTWCDMTTDGGGWTLVASFCTDYTWSESRSTHTNVFSTACRNAWSSNFGNLSTNDFRVLAAPNVTDAAAASVGDWYYRRNSAIPWKQWWAQSAGAVGLWPSAVTGSGRQGIAAFDSSTNLKFGVTNTAHKTNGLSDSAGTADFWAALTAPGTIDIYGISSDGSLGWSHNLAATGQDISGQHSSVGRDDTIATAGYGTTSTSATHGNGSGSTAQSTRLWFLVR